jgi:alkylhydroperoxidase/carboxymuconolactone decarboxylase family protein YurZ
VPAVAYESTEIFYPPEAAPETARQRKREEEKVAIRSGAMKTSETDQPANPWGSSLDKFKSWDPKGAEALLRVGTNPWASGVLPPKEVELIFLALNCACTNLDEAGTRRHIRAALDAGASREEILTVFKMASLLALHSCSLGAPILLEEAKAAGVEPRSNNEVPTPVCDKAREVGQWNTAWDPFFNLDPLWTEQVITAGLPIYMGAVIPPKLAELLSIAFDASYTHMYAPGTRRHIKAALKLGATIDEIMEVLKLCVAMGVQASAKGVPMLAEEQEPNSARKPSAA